MVVSSAMTRGGEPSRGLVKLQSCSGWHLIAGTFTCWCSSLEEEEEQQQQQQQREEEQQQEGQQEEEQQQQQQQKQ